MAVSATVPVSAQEAPLAEFTAADVFPATTAAYVEIPGPGQIVSDILQHPITGRLQQLYEGKVYIYNSSGILKKINVYKEGKFHSISQN